MTKYPPHPAANAFPMIEGAWMEDLVEDIKANGIREPVSLWRDPETGRALTLDGRNRFQAAELGGLALMQVPVRWVQTEDPFGFVMSANVLRRHLSVKQRREAAAELIALDPTRSDRQIAKATGISHPTVGKVRHELEENGDAERVTARTDTLGRSQPVSSESRTYPNPEDLKPPPPDPTIVKIMERDREREAAQEDRKRTAERVAEEKPDPLRAWLNASDPGPVGWFILMLEDFENANAELVDCAVELTALTVDPDAISSVAHRLNGASMFFRGVADEMSKRRGDRARPLAERLT